MPGLSEFRWGLVIQRTVRTLLVIVIPPPFGLDLQHPQAEVYVPVQKFLAELPIEALTLPVFPRTTWGNEGGPDALLFQPGIEGGFNELRPVIRAQVFRHSTTLSHH